MNVRIADRTLRKVWGDRRRMDRTYGQSVPRMEERVDEMERASDMAELKQFHPRLHPLGQDKKGVFSVDLDGPFRMYFEPDHDDIPQKPSGGIDYTKVTDIVIVNAKVDSHG